jgi:hypothetical protein
VLKTRYLRSTQKGTAPGAPSSGGSFLPLVLPYTVRTDDALKVRFSATVGEEAEIEVALV